MDYLKEINAIEIEGLSPQENRAYRAIEKWCVRLNRWEYSKTVAKRRVRKPLLSFSPNAVSLELIEARKQMLAHEISAEELMGKLHRIDIRIELNACMEAGF